MSINSATEYAQSLADDIKAHMAVGLPFGLEHVEEGWADIDDRDAVNDYLNNPDTEWREASAIDYLSDVLDINYILNADRSYKAARICIALGGPTAWVNTLTEQIECAWWSETVYIDLPREYVELLDDALEELFHC